MAVRDDIVVLWHLSPRIILIDKPSVEITIQDLHDTLRDIEDEPANLIYPTIITTAGKEQLGGGVTVGLTATLLNAKVGFEDRNDPYDNDPVTGGSNIILESDGTGHSFIDEGVLVGDIVLNIMDGSAATVLQITDETTLQHTPLEGGTLNTWVPGDTYTLFHVIQCDISGGNLVAVDSAGSEISPVLPTAFTQVVRTSSSSATLQELESIQYSSYNGRVVIDQVNGVDSLLFPSGTEQAPVKTLTVAKTIAVSRGFDELHFISPLTISSGEDISDYSITGGSYIVDLLTLEVGCITAHTHFYDCLVTGQVNGMSHFYRCSIDNVTNFKGSMINCQLNSNLTLEANGGTTSIIDSWSGVSGNATPTLDMGGTGNQLAVRRYSGGIEFTNNTSANDSSIDVIAGHIKIGATYSNGLFITRGVAKLTDNSTGTAVVDSANLVNPFTVADQVLEEVAADHVVDGTIGGTIDDIASKTRLIPGTL